jgi:hypothetical protein
LAGVDLVGALDQEELSQTVDALAWMGVSRGLRVDGEDAGLLRPGEDLAIRLAPGTHRIWLTTYRLWRSRIAVIDVEPGTDGAISVPPARKPGEQVLGADLRHRRLHPPGTRRGRLKPRARRGVRRGAWRLDWSEHAARGEPDAVESQVRSFTDDVVVSVVMQDAKFVAIGERGDEQVDGWQPMMRRSRELALCVEDALLDDLVERQRKQFVEQDGALACVAWRIGGLEQER